MDTATEFSTYLINNHRIVLVNETSSTNTLLDEIISGKGKKEHGLVVRTTHQTAGRGMMHTTWQDEKGKNLLFSLLVIPEYLSVSRQFYLSKITALAMLQCLEKYIPEERLAIKWPNDVLVSGKKICGILIRNSIKNENISHAIIGVGLNVNQTSFDNLPNAHSMFNELGSPHEPDQVLRIFLEQFDYLEKLLRSGATDKINELYLSKLFGYRKWKTYTSGSETFKGMILDVKEDGRLLLERGNGQIARYEIKEIRLVSAP